MPFSKAWRTAMYPDFRDQGAYVDYKASKEILHRMKEDIANPATPEELLESLIAQKKVAYEWCARKIDELLSVSEELYARSENLAELDTEEANGSIAGQHMAAAEASLLTPKEARLLAESIMHELLRVVETRNLNTDTIEHIVGRMYRYAVLGPTGDRWKSLGETYNFYDLPLDEVLCLLSRVFDRVTQMEELISAKGKASIPTGDTGSQVFDRRSVKYWVHMQDLPFVIARIIPNLPLSTFKDSYKESKEKKVQFRLGSPVSSVYWDNNNFLFYHRRLERLEGSSLIRMRWYSDTYEEDWNKVAETDSVFMEIKVHHEAWSGERSNKRRFALKEREVDAYVQGNLSLIPAVEKLKKKNASEKAQEEFKMLATEILSKIHAYDLKPALRTQCRRAAFQRGADQTVRVSIDTDLRMSAEDFGLGHHWCYTGGDSPITEFPYAVVEIKLQCAENERIPPWIEELMGCRYMESIPKFSKYAHGIASLYGHTSFINIVPYWMHQLDIDIRASTKPEQAHWDPTMGLASGCLERTADRVIFGLGHAQTQSVGASQAQFLQRSDYAKVYQRAVESLQESKKKEQQQKHKAKTRSSDADEAEKKGEEEREEAAAEPQKVPQHAPVVQYSVDRRHASFTTYHLYPYVESGAESLCFNPSDSRNAAAQTFYGLIPWQTGKRIKVPQKYDPKTLLTSERYMIKWMSLATQLGLLGIVTIHFGNGLFLPRDVATLPAFWQGQFHIVAGVLMVCAALGTLLYAYVGFKARARRVYARRKIRYDDTCGPTWLTFFLIVCFVMLTTTHITRRYGPMLTHSDSF